MSDLKEAIETRFGGLLQVMGRELHKALRDNPVYTVADFKRDMLPYIEMAFQEGYALGKYEAQEAQEGKDKRESE